MQATVRAFYLIYVKLIGVIILLGVMFVVVGSFLGKSLKSTGHSAVNTPPIAKHVAYQPQEFTGFLKVVDTVETLPNVTIGAETTPTKELAVGKPVAATDQPQSMEDMMKSMSPEERAEFEKLMKEFGAPTAETATPAPAKPKNPYEKMFGPYAAMLGPMIYVIFLGIILLYAVIIFSVAAYVQSRISNLMWNNTTLEHVGFVSNQRMRDLLWLYLSNIVVLVITLGLATPWAQIRMARYQYV